MKRFQLLSIFALACLAATASLNADNKDVLKNIDQSFAFFKFDGGKYPYMVKFNPGLNKIDMILCGTHNLTNDMVHLVTSPQDLATITPVQSTIKYVDAPLQMVENYKGKRQAYVGIALEDLLQAVRVYKGIFLVDEYKANLPQKWVVRSADLSPLVSYLRKSFEQAQIAPADQKPVLLLELLDKKQAISQDDQAFLNAFYEMVDPQDPVIFEFFKRANDLSNEALTATANNKIVGERLGEEILRKIESFTGEFEGRKLFGIVLSAIATKLVYDKVSTLFCTKSDKAMAEVCGNDGIEKIAIILGLAVAGCAAYGYAQSSGAFALEADASTAVMA